MLYFLLFLSVVKFTIATCPNNGYEWQKHCFYFKNISKGFADAESDCVLLGGHLASIHDGFTNALLAQKASEYFRESTITDFWIGLTNLMTFGNWTWMDGTQLDFQEWASGEPKNATGNNCGTLPLSNGLWKADDCFKDKPFVCQTNSTPTYPSYANCTGTLAYFQPTHACYGVSEYITAYSWTDAEDYCISLGGHLASIHSYEEERFLLSFVYYAWVAAWTGAFSNDDGKNWKWSDGTSWDYNPWFAGEPTANTSGCGRIDTYQDGSNVCKKCGLYRSACGEQRKFICKVPL